MPVNKLDKGGIRRSQVITTYGIGSVVPVGDESVMIAGIDRWSIGQSYIHEPRLERQLGVCRFVLPPASDSGNHIPVVRFPSVCYCPTCRRLDEHRFFTAYADNTCSLCKTPLVPSRFVVVCSRGHIDDFPYFQWVHAEHKRKEGVRHNLRIDAGGVSASLRDIIISCSCGVPPRSMQGAFGREALRFVRRCSGRRPWLGDEEACDEIPRTLQRGATNVYFPIVRSAISIPPWSEGALRVLNRYWNVLRVVPAEALAATITGLCLAASGEYTVGDLVEAALQRRRSEQSDDSQSRGDSTLREQEYDALSRGRAEASRSQEFVCVPTDCVDATAEWFDRVMLVKRLREVRVLEAFTRLLPWTSADPPERRSPLSQTTMDWLPAIEVIGEGVFMQLNVGRLQVWETDSGVVARVAHIDRNYRAKFAELKVQPDRVITPRLVLIHTLAHALINEWSLASGYPAASLRERLYVSDDMAGLLIYTATTDAAGSLGGVVAQARSNRLADTLREAVERAAWCSADPLCVEADAAGVDALNLAACHSCVLLPEVSCELSNVFLDRAMLVGTPGNPTLGFFRTLLSEA